MGMDGETGEGYCSNDNPLSGLDKVDVDNFEVIMNLRIVAQTEALAGH